MFLAQGSNQQGHVTWQACFIFQGVQEAGVACFARAQNLKDQFTLNDIDITSFGDAERQVWEVRDDTGALVERIRVREMSVMRG